MPTKTTITEEADAAKETPPAADKKPKAPVKAKLKPEGCAKQVQEVIDLLQPFDESGIMAARNAVHHLKLAMTPLGQFCAK